MTGADPRNITFAQLDARKGIPSPPPTAEEEFPLPAWYRKVRDIPLSELSIEDVSRACRQGIHLDHIVPLAIHFLGQDPLAGEMYDGELLVAMKSVPREFWKEQKIQRDKLVAIIQNCVSGLSGDIKKDADELLNRLRTLARGSGLKSV